MARSKFPIDRSPIFFPILGQSQCPWLQTNKSYLTWVNPFISGIVPWCYTWTWLQYDPLQCGVNCNPFDTSPWVNSNNFGIELSLGYQLAQSTGRRVYFCKVSRWATGMYPWWSVPDRYPTTVGGMFQSAVSKIQAARSALQMLGGYSFKFIYTHQCETDAENATKANAYLANRRFYIQEMRNALWMQSLIDIYPRIHPDEINSTIFPATPIISTAQDTMSTDPNTIMIPTDSLLLNTGHIHLTDQSQLDLADFVYAQVRPYY